MDDQIYRAELAASNFHARVAIDELLVPQLDFGTLRHHFLLLFI